MVDNASPNMDVENISDWLKKKSLDFLIVDRTNFNTYKNNAVERASIVVVQNHENKGYSAGNNVVLNYLLTHRVNELIWILNPDTVVQGEVLEHLVQLTSDRLKVIIGNVMYHNDQKDKIIRYGGFKVNNLIHGISYITEKSDVNKIDAISGASLFTRIETFKDIGLMSEEYFMYWEETDFCTKAKQKGYYFEVNGESKIFDRGGTVSNSSFLREYLYLFNGLRYYKKYKPLNLPLILISTTLKQIIALLIGNKIKSKAIFYAHLDFIFSSIGMEISIRKRILQNSK